MTSGTDHLLVAAFERLDEDRVLFLVRRGLEAGQSVPEVLALAREGLERVESRYQKGEYFLADLLMVAHIFKLVLAELMETAPVEPLAGMPPVVFGTVEGDIHEIGKDLTIALMRFAGLSVIDLGRDVSPQRFVEAVVSSGATVVCLSGLTSTCYRSMRRTVAALGKAGVRCTTTVLIGGAVNEPVKTHVGADYWTTDCLSGVSLCQRLLDRSHMAGVTAVTR